MLKLRDRVETLNQFRPDHVTLAFTVFERRYCKNSLISNWQTSFVRSSWLNICNTCKL